MGGDGRGAGNQLREFEDVSNKLRADGTDKSDRGKERRRESAGEIRDGRLAARMAYGTSGGFRRRRVVMK
jgi:hypothetical protein